MKGSNAMGRVQWVKIDTDIYKNEKIELVRDMAKDEIHAMMVWIALLALAGKRNVGGRLMATENRPYTPRMLAREFRFPQELIEEALEIFIQLRMVVEEDGVYRIRDWENHQNLEKIERRKEQNRQYQVASRARKKEASTGETNAKELTQTTPTAEDYLRGVIFEDE